MNPDPAPSRTLLVSTESVRERYRAVNGASVPPWVDIGLVTDEELDRAGVVKIVVSNIVDDAARYSLVDRLRTMGAPATKYDVDVIEGLEARAADRTEEQAAEKASRRAWLKEQRKDSKRIDREAERELDAEELAESASGERYVEFIPAFWDQPPVEFAIPNLLIEGQIGVIYAQGGVGKSLLAQDIAVGRACRGRIFGETVEIEPVLYIDEEGSRRGLAKRLIAMGYEGETLKDLHYSLLAGWAPLDTPEGGAELVAEVIRTGARLVVLDTASKLISGPENDNDTWSRLHRHTMIPLRQRGVTVVIVDHAGKDLKKGQRGGSAKQNNIDAVWLLEVAGTAVKLTCEKDREGDYGGMGAAVYLERNLLPMLEHVKASESVSAAFESYLEFETAVDDAIATLDRLGVPRTASQVVASKDLKDAGYEHFTRVVVREAVRRRKDDGSLRPATGELGAAAGDDDD